MAFPELPLSCLRTWSHKWIEILNLIKFRELTYEYCPPIRGVIGVCPQSHGVVIWFAYWNERFTEMARSVNKVL